MADGDRLFCSCCLCELDLYITETCLLLFVHLCSNVTVFTSNMIQVSLWNMIGFMGLKFKIQTFLNCGISFSIKAVSPCLLIRSGQDRLAKLL
jgi:hypothetical protein